MKRTDGHILLAAVLLPLLLAAPAGAQVCTDVSTTPVAFGNYDRNAGPSDATGAVTVTCDADLPYQVELTTGGAAGFDPRQMQHISQPYQLNYNLYLDASRNVIWGDGTSGTQLVAGTGTGGTEVHQVYGRIPASQSIGVGSYSDVVSATVLW